MSLTVLEILLIDGTQVGSIILNGPKGTILKKFNIKNKYQDRLTRKNLFRENNDYDSFEFPHYISMIKKGLSEDIGKKVFIEKIELTATQKLKLTKQYQI